MIEKFENIIDQNLIDEIEEVFSDPNVVWQYNETTSEYNFDPNLFPNVLDVPQMVHPIFENGVAASPHINLVMKPWEKLIERNKLLVTHMRRVKANLNIQQPNFESTFTPHPDHENSRYLSALYYINDSDGDSIFYNNEGKELDRHTPKAGTFLLFPSNVIHAGSPPRKHKRRMVINYLFSV